jgi:fructuronate reductase
VPGLLAEALRRRRAAGAPPLTIMSCDNLPSNGRVTRGVVIAFAAARDPGLARWVDANIAFPSSMVDRIVPATTAEDRAEAARRLGLEDAWPIVTEPFLQWVIEDRFAGPHPAFEIAGCEIVTDVEPYEHMKLRLLNGAHSAIAYLGQLAGYETVAEVVADPIFRSFITAMMTDEVMSTLTLPRAELLGYRDRLMARFANAALNHRTRQIAKDGSLKLPQRLLGSIRDRIAAGLPHRRLTLAVAAWVLYCCRVENLDDPAAGRIAGAVRAAGSDPRRIADAFLGLDFVFGADLPAEPAFRTALSAAIESLDRQGVAQSLAAAL